MNLLLVVGGGFLLLAVGTLLGRYYAPDRRPLRRAAAEGQAYVRGLVELLEGNDDAAIASISEALKENTKTVEAYFALGTLFRKRDEHERAVRVHQAILMRRDLDRKTRSRVHFQLALDFRAAGFPKRAVKALEAVVAQDKKHVAAWTELAALFEQTGQWERAALAQRRLGKVAGQDTSARQAHLWAALATRQLEDDEPDAARKSLRRAVSASKDSIHVLHVLARYQQHKGNLSAAAKAWEKALRRAPNLAAYFLPRLEQVLFELNKLGRVDRILDDLLEADADSAQLRLAQARQEAKRSPARALKELSDLLDEHPGLIPARREAARLVLRKGDEDQVRDALTGLLEVLQRADRGYRCGDCGEHAADDLFWHCPRCQAWGSVKVAWGRRRGEGRGAKNREPRAENDR